MGKPLNAELANDGGIYNVMQVPFSILVQL